VRLRSTTIKRSLLLTFGAYFLVSTLLAGLVLYSDWKKASMEKLFAKISQVKDLLHKGRHFEKDFFGFETLEPSFYQTGKSDYLDAHKSTFIQIKTLIDSIKSDPFFEQKNHKSIINQAVINLDEYEVLFDSLVQGIAIRGFKNHGIEGYMRMLVHEFDPMSDLRLREKVLMLRRHEKDYILRKEINYYHSVIKSADALVVEIEKTSSLNRNQRSHFKNLIRDYLVAFDKLKSLEEQIGFRKGDGLKFKLAQASEQSQAELDLLVLLVEEQKNTLQLRSKLLLYAVLLIGLLMILLLGYIIDSNLNKPIATLSDDFHQAIKNKFDPSFIQVNKYIHQGEIGKLAKDFKKTLEQIRKSFHVIEANTQALEQQNSLMTDSLRYALTIQQTILPNPKQINKFFTDHFVIYRPQAIVSGDFYWFLKKKDKLYLALVDCTGHGVPGAFMSLIGYTALNHLVDQQKISEPKEVLQALDEHIANILRQEETKNADGMDVALCAIELTDGVPSLMHFSGAKRPFYLARNGVLTRYEGTKRSVGGTLGSKSKDRPFEQISIDLSKNDKLYFFSDGLTDLVDIENKRFGSKGFEVLCRQLMDFPLAEQSLLWSDQITALCKQKKQRDDLTFFVLEV